MKDNAFKCFPVSLFMSVPFQVQYEDVNSVVIVEENGLESDRIQLPHAVLPEMV